MYRVASIMNKRFTDDVAINPFQDKDADKAERDLVSMGLFVVRPK